MEEFPREELRSKEVDVGPDAASLREEQNGLQQEIRGLRIRIEELETEIRGMRNSLSWKITKPLRCLVRRLIHSLPGVNAVVHRTLGLAQDTLVTTLPRNIAQPLFGNFWRVRENIEEQIGRYRGSRLAGQRKIVFYTAIFGEYDNLLLPDQIDPSIDYVCFTDRLRNNYGVWQMRSAPYSHPDPTRVARYVKTHPSELFPGHEIAVWLDANIVLKGDVQKYIDTVTFDRAHLGLVSHPHRSCFYEEAEACKKLGKDDHSIIDAQVDHYRKHGLPLNQPLFETGFMIVPLRNAGTVAALHCWWEQIERFSRRDQLAFAWVGHQFPELKIALLLPLGASVRHHPDFQYFRHAFARAVKIPDVLLKAGEVVEPARVAAISKIQ